jgi:hypothetical protein
MKISKLDAASNKPFLPTDKNGRSISIYNLDQAELVGDIFYPNALVYSHLENVLYNPINERTMSLGDNKRTDFLWSPRNRVDIVETPVFFFLYNTDNYYHFVYDTLPYLISYFEAKKTYPDLKLLITKPNPNVDIYPFVAEFLELAGVKKEELLFAQRDITYNKMLVSDSYTHGHDSNLPPRLEIYSFLQSLTKKVEEVESYGKKIYVSRRSWIHNDTSNIGTNYTNRRKLENEDKLVAFLTSLGYNELFTELLSTKEKLGVFKQATCVVGAIGGGMCNTLFSPSETRVECIVSPYFLDINARFRYCFNSNTRYWTDTKHTEKGKFKKYMRVKFEGNKIGEINDINGNQATVAFAESTVSGWNSSVAWNLKQININELEKIDDGLNSEWSMNLEVFQENLEK